NSHRPPRRDQAGLETFMLTIAVLAGLVSLAPAEPATAADAVTLRDGRVVLGQVVEPAPRGKVILLVRRAWAEAHVPDLLKRWEAAEAPSIKQARGQRRQRLEDWRRDRREARAD